MSIAKVGSIEMYYEEHGSGDPLLLIAPPAFVARLQQG